MYTYLYYISLSIYVYIYIYIYPSIYLPKQCSIARVLNGEANMCVYTYIYIHMCMYIYIYIYIRMLNRREPIRFGLFRFQTFSKNRLFGSVRFGKSFFPVRCDSACVFRTRRGSVRFGSVGFHVRFWPVPELSGSVRFGSVSYSFLSDGRVRDYVCDLASNEGARLFCKHLAPPNA